MTTLARLPRRMQRHHYKDILITEGVTSFYAKDIDVTVYGGAFHVFYNARGIRRCFHLGRTGMLKAPAVKDLQYAILMHLYAGGNVPSMGL